ALKTNRESGLVVWQYPPASRKIPGTEKVAVLVESNDDDNIVMADLVGLNMRTALAVLNYQGIAFELEGCGVVKKQFPEMGTKISKKTKCRLVCGNG
ncbi:MAG TPA: PASTA domain-containing protein, partial [candidate division Zixibacteria bacterium]|nr:PASTA domain-containing protein [candidate division Zixibacteria bacterium]